MAIEAVQKDTVPVSNSEPQRANSGASAPESQPKPEEAPAAKQETTEGQEKPAQDQTGQEETPAGTSQAEQGAEAGKTELSPEERIAQAIEQRLSSKAQAEKATAEEPEDVNFEVQVNQQKEELQKSVNEQLQKIDEQKQSLSEKLENGDIELNKYLAENEKLTQQRYDAQREADRNLLSLDNKLEQHNQSVQGQIRAAREAYTQQNPDFIEKYQSGQINEALRDPQIRNVFGDNPAAVHQYLRSTELQQENQTLKQQLEELKKQQESAIKSSAANPNAKVGTQSGGNHPTNQQSGPSAEDPMVAALRAARTASGAVQ